MAKVIGAVLQIIGLLVLIWIALVVIIASGFDFDGHLRMFAGRDWSFMQYLVLAMVLACIPAAIASSKNRSFAAWWVYGLILFIIALPHAALTDRKPDRVETPEIIARERDAFEGATRSTIIILLVALGAMGVVMYASL